MYLLGDLPCNIPIIFEKLYYQNEGGFFFGDGVGFDCASVGADDLSGDAKADAGAFGFGGEKGDKYFV